MNTQEFMKALFLETEGNEKLEEYKKGLPIGRDENGNILLAQKRDKTLTVRNTCATGAGRTDFIRRLIITLSCLYEKDQACFFVLSPKTEYGDLIRLHSADVTVPYIRNKEDIDKAVETLKECCGCESKAYNTFSNFRNRVIDIAVKEINEKTLFTLSYEYVKKGKSVIALIFHINMKYH